MVLVDYIAGMIISVLAGMGIGGGGFLVLYLVYIKNMAQIDAQGVNLIFFIFTAVASLFYHRKKRRIDYKTCIVLCLFGGVGAIIGAMVANYIGANTVRKIFGWLLVVSGVVTLLKNKKE